MTFRQTLKKIFTPPLFVLAAAYVLFEDTILHWATLAMREVGKVAPIGWLERLMARLPPYPAMVLFALPIALLFPIKLLALWVIARGHVITGAVVILLAKTLSTTLEAWLYRVLRPSLAQLHWFVRFEAWLFGWRDRLYAYVRSLPAWQRFRRAMTRAKTWLRGRSWLRRRFDAARRRARTEPEG